MTNNKQKTPPTAAAIESLAEAVGEAIQVSLSDVHPNSVATAIRDGAIDIQRGLENVADALRQVAGAISEHR